MTPTKSPLSMVTPGGESLEPAAFERAKDILHHLANTVSAMKIYPSEHATVAGFVDGLTQKLREFLDAHGKLEIWVEEYSFSCGGKPVYTDPMTIKSLPFFFFKDGMQMLYFYQGIDRGEILAFLELIKLESQKPAEDADIVTALWEKDLPNIQYFAPDEFLEGRILEERSESRTGQGLAVLPEFAQEVIQVKIDTSKFAQGKIKLNKADREAVRNAAKAADGPEPQEPAAPTAEGPDGGSGESREAKRSPAAAMDPTLTEQEIRALETLVRANRTLSPDEEFVGLMVEILFLEESLAAVSASLDVLLDYHVDRLAHGDFAFSIRLVHKTRELLEKLAAENPAKAALLEAFEKKVVSPETVGALKGLLAKTQTVEWDGLIRFFNILGGSAMPVAADLYEMAPPEFRARIMDFLWDASRRDPGAITALVGDERPQLARAVIELLARTPGHKGLPHFSMFLGFRNKEIKREVIRALGRIRNEMSNRILLGFLKDKDEDLRVEAALTLNPLEETTRIRHLIREAGSKEFRVKSLKEKSAILSFLGRTRSEEALSFLRQTLERRSLFRNPQAEDMRVAAVAGLERMGTPEAVRLLERAARDRTAAVREAGAGALARLARGIAGGGEGS